MKIVVHLANKVDPRFAAEEIKTISEQITGLPGYVKIKNNPSISIGGNQ